MGAAFGKLAGTSGSYKVNLYNNNNYKKSSSKSSDAFLKTTIKMLKQSSRKRFFKIVQAPKQTVSKPVMFYACANSLEVLLAIAGPKSRYMEYVPDNGKEVESTTRDYIDMLENPTLNIIPTQRKVEA